jgi:hypothetical protein
MVEIAKLPTYNSSTLICTSYLVCSSQYRVKYGKYYHQVTSGRPLILSSSRGLKVSRLSVLMSGHYPCSLQTRLYCTSFGMGLSRGLLYISPSQRNCEKTQLDDGLGFPGLPHGQRRSRSAPVFCVHISLSHLFSYRTHHFSREARGPPRFASYECDMIQYLSVFARCSRGKI